MKQFLSFVRKEFHHVFRDRKTLLLLFGMPIVQIILFGFALTNEIENSHIVVCDYAKDNASAQLINKLEASKYFDIHQNIMSYQQINEAFKSGKVKLAIVFPANFGTELQHTGKAPVQIIADASDPNTAGTLTGYATSIIKDYEMERKAETLPPLQINTIVRMVYNPELKGATSFVPGVMALVLMLICVLMTSSSIVREKESGTMEILLVSPFNPLLVIVSKAVPYFLLSLINLSVILLLSVFLLDLPIKGSVALLFVESSILVITALALGLLISNSTNSQQAAMLISLMGLLLPVMMFTGFMFPLESMPKILQYLSNIVPSKWYYIIVKNVMIKGLGFREVWKETLILIGMALFLLILSIRNFKNRLA